MKCAIVGFEYEKSHFALDVKTQLDFNGLWHSELEISSEGDISQ